jgi:hypothetical protein
MAGSGGGSVGVPSEGACREREHDHHPQARPVRCREAGHGAAFRSERCGAGAPTRSRPTPAARAKRCRVMSRLPRAEPQQRIRRHSRPLPRWGGNRNPRSPSRGCRWSSPTRNRRHRTSRPVRPRTSWSRDPTSRPRWNARRSPRSPSRRCRWSSPTQGHRRRTSRRRHPRTCCRRPTVQRPRPMGAMRVGAPRAPPRVFQPPRWFGSRVLNGSWFLQTPPERLHDDSHSECRQREDATSPR